jgi:hypothetical protein
MLLQKGQAAPTMEAPVAANCPARSTRTRLPFFSPRKANPPYIGFDQVSTAAQESKNPVRDMPIGILGSLAICTVIYILVACVLTGLVKYTSLDAPAPIAMAIDVAGMSWGSKFVKPGAICGLNSAMVVTLYGFIVKFGLNMRRRRLRLFDGFRSYAAMPNSSAIKVSCAIASSFATHLTLPFRILFTASIPCNLRQAVNNALSPFCQPRPLLHRAMVLLHDSIQVLAWTETSPTGKNIFFLHRFHDRRIGRVLAHMDHPRHALAGRVQISELVSQEFLCPVSTGKGRRFTTFAEF